MTNQTYTPNMVTDETVAEFWRIYRANSQTEVSPCTKTALRAIMAPLWAEVQHLREAKRELVEALTKAEDDLSTYQMVIDGLYKDNRMWETLTESRKILAKHGGDHAK